MTLIQVQATNESLPANTIYVSPTGTVGAAGTSTAPTSLLEGIRRAVSGQTVALYGTVQSPYRLTSQLSISKQLNLVAVPGQSPVISGAKVLTGFQYESSSASYYLAYDITLPALKPDVADPDFPLSVKQHQLFLNYERLVQVETKSALTSGTFYIEEATPRRVYIKDNPAGKLVEATAAFGGVFFPSGASQSYVVGIGFEKFANQNISLGASSGVTFSKCSFWHSSYCSVYLGDGDSTLFDECLANYNGGHGYRITSQAGHQVYGGQVCFNNLANFSKEYNAGGIKQSGDKVPLSSYTPNEYIGIEVTDNNCVGIWVDVNSRDTRIASNLVARNTNGIFVEISQGVYVVNNLVINQGVGIYIAESENVKVYNNISSLNKEAVRIKDTTRTSDTGIQWKVRNLELCNNIFDRRDGVSSTSALIYTQLSGGRTTTSAQMFSKMSNNAFFRATVDAPTNLYRWYQSAGVATLYPYLDQFKAANPGLEEDTIIRPPSTTFHPYFVALNSYEVKLDSPTLGAGTVVNSVVAGLLGVPVGTVVDIGVM